MYVCTYILKIILKTFFGLLFVCLRFLNAITIMFNINVN